MTQSVMVDFEVPGGAIPLRVELSQPAYLYGITFIALAPGHPHIGTESALHPLTGDEIPVYTADFASQSGTKAFACVPWHETTSWDFAVENDLLMQQVVIPHFSTPRENEEYRGGGCGIVFDPTSQKYAVYQTPAGITGFFSGGVEADEDMVEGVLREVREESGLFDFAETEIIAEARAHYHNRLKNVNRVADATAILVRLASTRTQAHAREAHETFELAWQTPHEMLENWRIHDVRGGRGHWEWFLQLGVGRAIELGWDTTNNPKEFYREPYEGEGTLIHSGPLTDMATHEASQATLELFNEKGVYWQLNETV